jgi:hypothetical protein
MHPGDYYLWVQGREPGQEGTGYPGEGYILSTGPGSSGGRPDPYAARVFVGRAEPGRSLATRSELAHQHPDFQDLALADLRTQQQPHCHLCGREFSSFPALRRHLRGFH